MFRAFLAFARPLHTIARELSILRELAELYCNSQGIFRRIENPTKDDTEITYSSDDPDDRRRGLSKWLRRGEQDDIQGEE